MVDRHDCDHCPQHEVNTLRIQQNCDKLKVMEQKHRDLEKVIIGTDGIATNLALVRQTVADIHEDIGTVRREGAKKADVAMLQKIVIGLIITALGVIVKEVISGRGV